MRQNIIANVRKLLFFIISKIGMFWYSTSSLNITFFAFEIVGIVALVWLETPRQIGAKTFT